MTSRTVPPASSQIAAVDDARTFAESDVTLTHSSTEARAESVALANQTGETTLFPNTTLTGQTGKFGVRLSTDASGYVNRVGGRLNGTGNTGTHDVVLEKESDGTEIARVADLTAGDSFTMDGFELAQSTDYLLYWDVTSSSDVDYDDDGEAEADPVGVTLTDFKGADDLYVFDKVRTRYTTNTSGSVTVEWPEPDDVFAWDVLSFTRRLAGETVDVFVESSSDGGSTWTEVAGPVTRNDAIPVPDDERVRFRVDFSRASTANVPTLDSIARRYVL